MNSEGGALGSEPTPEQLLGAALEQAENHRTAKSLYAAINEHLSLDFTYAAWRGMANRHPDLREQINAKLQRAPVIDETPQAEPFDVERFFELKAAAAAEWAKKKHNPTYTKRRIDTDSPVALVFTSDWHVGGQGTEHLQIRTDNQIIANHPQLYACVGGDWADNFVIPALAHAGRGAVFAEGDEQYTICRYLWNIFADSVVMLGDGNHTDWTYRASGLDAEWIIPEGLRPLYTNNGAVMALQVGETTYRIFRRHRPRFSSYINPGHSVVQEYRSGPYEFDIGVIEHHHQPHYSTFDGKYRDNGTTVRIAVRTGTYKVEDSHAKKHGYYYGSDNLVCILLWPDRFRFQPVYGLQQAIEDVENAV